MFCPLEFGEWRLLPRISISGPALQARALMLLVESHRKFAQGLQPNVPEIAEGDEFLESLRRVFATARAQSAG